MIGKSFPEYVLVMTCIAGLRSIAPLSFLYLAVSAYQRQFVSPRWLAPYTIIEASFYLFVYLPRKRHLQAPARFRPPPLSRTQRQNLFQKCLDHTRETKRDDFPSGWFSPPLPKLENIKNWILWTLFAADLDTYDEDWTEEINGYVTALEKVVERKFPSGSNEQAKAMRLDYDPVGMSHRPLLWYIIVGIVDAGAYLALQKGGFRHYVPPRWFSVFPPRPLAFLFSRRCTNPTLPYWYRPHKAENKAPILFLHGIGIGLFPYVSFLKEIARRDPDVGIIAIELLPICMRITHAIPYRDEICDAILDILDEFDIDRFVIAAHSYGTVVASHIHHRPLLAPRIAGTLFIDPIPFLLHLPNVAFNFLYRQPRQANEWMVWYTSSRDPDIARVLARRFFWAENVLWREDLEGKRVTVVLSGQDQIVHSEEVRKYLTREEVMNPRWRKGDLEVLFFPELDHATIFNTKKRREPLLEILQSFSHVESTGAI